MTPIILFEIMNIFFNSLTLFIDFLNAAKATLSLFSNSFCSIYTGDDNALRMIFEYSFEGTCPNKYRVIVISPKPNTMDNGAFPILYNSIKV